MAHLFILLLIGMAIRVFTRAPDHFHRSINHFILYLALPATVVLKLPPLWKSFLKQGSVSPIFLQPWLWFGLVFVTVFLFHKSGKLTRGQAGSIFLVVGLGNTSFVGLPVLREFLGEESLALGLLLDQLGSFLILSTVALPLGTWWKSGGRPWSMSSIQKVLLFPPFVALIVSLVFVISDNDLNVEVTSFFKTVSATLVPLALVSVGYQLNFAKLLNRGSSDPLPIPILSFSVLAKVVLAPLLSVFAAKLVMAPQTLEAQVLVLESSMGSMLTAGIVAEELGFDTQLTQSIVAISIVVSLVLAPFWNSMITI